MERMTHRYVGGTAWASVYKVSACGENECKGPIIDRLAAYEDTGLEPEEITTERPACVFYCNRQCNLNGDFCAEGPGCPFELDGAKARKFLLQITQPNTPLTLEELREMDGEPVFVTVGKEPCIELGFWVLVEVCGDTGRVWLTNNLGGRTGYDTDAELGDDEIRAYRCKPEEGIT